MKITPIAKGAGAQQNASLGQTASPDKLARAKAIASGQDPAQLEQASPQEFNDPQVRRIKRKTNFTPPPEPIGHVETADPVAPKADNSGTGEPALAVSGEPRQLSPEAVAIAKQRRDLAVREKLIADKEARLANPQDPGKDLSDLKERLKSDPFGVLIENGVDLDVLTQQVLKDTEGNTPTVKRLESELRSLKEALKKQDEGLTERDQAQDAQVVKQLQTDADRIVAAEPEIFELVGLKKASKKAVELIQRVFSEEGVILDVREALEEIENSLLEESLSLTASKKVQQKQQQARQPITGNPGQMRTLSNRDSVAPTQSRRERAIAAARGIKLE